MSGHDGVDLAPDVMEHLSFQMDEVVKDLDHFKAVIVQQDRFYDKPICPHCGYMELPDHLRSFVEDGGAFVGDITMCMGCKQIIIPLKWPVFGRKKPIFLDWKVKR